MTLNTSLGESIYSVEVITDRGESNLLTGTSIEYFYLIEDIYSFSITGKISFWDKIGLMEFGPINGNEIFRITFGNTNGSADYRTIDMRIYKIAKVTNPSGLRSTDSPKLEILLIDDTFQKFHSKGWSKSWVNTKTSTIIRDICSNHLDISSFGNFEESNEVMPHFDTHLRSPADNIVWLMNRSSSISSGQPGYMMYRYNTKIF